MISEPGRRVVFTWRWINRPEIPPGSSTVEFALGAKGGGTLIRLTHAVPPPEKVDLHRMGWVHHLGGLAEVAVDGYAGPGIAISAPYLIVHSHHCIGPGSDKLALWYSFGMRTTIDQAGRVVIPKILRNALGLVPGEVELTRDGAGVRIEPVPGEGATETGGWLIIEAEAHLTDDDVRSLRLSDQR